MARFCTNCGKMLAENARFCPTCGVQIKQAPITQEQPTVQPPVTDNDAVQSFEEQVNEYEEAKEIPLQPTEEEPAVFCTAEPEQPKQPEAPAFECRKEDNTAWTTSVMSYFGLMLLFSIPVVGLIACIVMSFALKNKNTRNFARAALIFIVVCLLVLCLLTAAGIALWNEIVEALEDEYGDIQIKLSAVAPKAAELFDGMAF